jgi:hypothetical protein
MECRTEGMKDYNTFNRGRGTKPFRITGIHEYRHTGIHECR